MLGLLLVTALAADAPAALRGAPWFPLLRGGEPLADGVDAAAGELAGSPAAWWAASADALQLAWTVDDAAAAAARTFVVLVDLDDDESVEHAVVVEPAAVDVRVAAPVGDVVGVVGAAAFDAGVRGGAAWRGAGPELRGAPFPGVGVAVAVPRALIGLDDVTPFRLVLLVDGDPVADVAGCAAACGALADAATDPVAVDADLDGLVASLERAVGSDPSLVDSDGDGIPDRHEGFDDPDRDGRPAIIDPDADDDGIGDGLEGFADLDGDGKPNHVDTNADGDLFLDATEGRGDVDCDGKPNFLDAADDDAFCDPSVDTPSVDDDWSDDDPAITPASPDDFARGCAHVGPGSLGLLGLLALRRRRR